MITVYYTPMTSAHTPTVAIETHGCKLNQADSLRLAKEFSSAGYRVVAFDDLADVYVLNSCTVTHVADRKGRHALRSARRRNPGATIVATGCYPQRAPDELSKLEEVDLILGNFAKPNLVKKIVEGNYQQPTTPCGAGTDELSMTPIKLRSRAMVKIQEGCNQVCTYCIVPKVRGRERSIPVKDLISEINTLHMNGYKEVVLTGTQLGSYGFDLENTDLVVLLNTILSETNIDRLRVSSLQPQEITDELLDLWADPRLCPHFHMPLQSGSDIVLKNMHRRYNSKQYLQAVTAINTGVNAASITGDIICGFPGETEDMFRETFEICEAIGFADAHVFPYSARPGTSASYLDHQLDSESKKRRVSALLTTIHRQAKTFRENMVGQIRPVLWERRSPIGRIGPAEWIGLTDNYIRVVTNDTRTLANEITQAQLFDYTNDVVVARVIDV